MSTLETMLKVAQKGVGKSKMDLCWEIHARSDPLRESQFETGLNWAETASRRLSRSRFETNATFVCSCSPELVHIIFIRKWNHQFTVLLECMPVFRMFLSLEDVVWISFLWLFYYKRTNNWFALHKGQWPRKVPDYNVFKLHLAVSGI